MLRYKMNNEVTLKWFCVELVFRADAPEEALAHIFRHFILLIRLALSAAYRPAGATLALSRSFGEADGR